MARVTVFTAERMQIIENTTIVDGEINAGGDLILARRDGVTINAGKVSGPKGDGGAGVTNVDVTYQASSSGTNEPTGDWKTNIPLVPDGWYLWTKTVTTYAEPTNPGNSFKTVTFGVMKNSLPGSDGTGIQSVFTDYQPGHSGVDVPIGPWFPGVPTVDPGKFLWTRTTTTYTDQTKNVAYSVAKQGSDGQNGTSADNNYLHVAYANSADGRVDFSTSDPSGRTYLGIAETEERPDPTDPGVYAWSLIKGASGAGISSSQVHYQSSSSGTDTPPGPWTESIPVVPDGEFLWTRTTINFTDGASQTVYSVAKQGVPGVDGRGVVSITEEYYLSHSPEELIGGSWSVNKPEWVAGKFYWTRSVVRYTSGNPTTTEPICASGSDGKAVSDVDVLYYSSTSPNHLSGGSWSTESPAWISGRYIWTKTITSYTDGASVESNPVCVTGSKGDSGETGNGIETVTIRYHASVYGTQAPDGNWTENIPTVPEGHYLWTRTVTRMTDGSETTSYSVARQGVSGQPGDDGVDGRGITLIVAMYQVGESGAIRPTGEWFENIPEVPDGQYLWTRLTTNYTYGEPTVAYTVGKMGEPGPPPPPLYMWVMYADDNEGSNMSQEPANKAYIGISANRDTPTPSMNPGEYLWSLIQGEGVDGRGVVSTRVIYRKGVGAPPRPETVEQALIDGWGYDEPTYETGSLDNLYTLIATEFSDGTRALSPEVQLSSTYHAAKGAYSLAEGLYQVIPSQTEPTSSPSGALKQGDQWWVIGTGERSGEFVGINVYNGTQWVSRTLYADSIIALNSITSKVLHSEEIWASEAWIDVLSAGAIKVDYLEPNYGEKLNIWASEAVEIIVGRQDEQEVTLGGVAETSTNALTSAEDAANAAANAHDAAVAADEKAVYAAQEAATTAADLEEHKSVFRVTATGVEITTPGREKSLTLTPAGISMLDQNTVVTRWENTRMIVNEAILNRAQIASHIMEAHSPGRTIIRPSK